MNTLGATSTLVRGSAHLDGGDARLPAHQDTSALQRGYTRVQHARVRCDEVGHVKQPIGAEQVREAAAAIQRVGRKGDKEAHASALVLQAAASGAPLGLLRDRGSLGLWRPVGRGRPGGGASARAPPPASEGPAHWRHNHPTHPTSSRRRILQTLGTAFDPSGALLPTSTRWRGAPAPLLTGACACPSSRFLAPNWNSWLLGVKVERSVTFGSDGTPSIFTELGATAIYCGFAATAVNGTDKNPCLQDLTISGRSECEGGGQTAHRPMLRGHQKVIHTSQK